MYTKSGIVTNPLHIAWLLKLKHFKGWVDTRTISRDFSIVPIFLTFFSFEKGWTRPYRGQWQSILMSHLWLPLNNYSHFLYSGLQRSSTSDRPTVDWETLFEAAPISHPSGIRFRDFFEKIKRRGLHWFIIHCEFIVECGHDYHEENF